MIMEGLETEIDLTRSRMDTEDKRFIITGLQLNIVQEKHSNHICVPITQIREDR